MVTCHLLLLSYVWPTDHQRNSYLLTRDALYPLSISAKDMYTLLKPKVSHYATVSDPQLDETVYEASVMINTHPVCIMSSCKDSPPNPRRMLHRMAHLRYI